VLAVVFRRFLGVSILIPGVLVPGVWVLGVASQGVPSQGVASSGPGGFRLTRLLQIIASELWLAGYFKGCFVRGSVREVRIYF
jgi:hypothetical protein